MENTKGQSWESHGPSLTCPFPIAAGWEYIQGSDLTQARGKGAREGCRVISLGDCGRHIGYTPIHGIPPVMWGSSRVPKQ